MRYSFTSLADAPPWLPPPSSEFFACCVAMLGGTSLGEEGSCCWVQRMKTRSKTLKMGQRALKSPGL